MEHEIINIGFDLPELDVNKTPDEKQRTEDWHKARLGKFTGSKMSELMACGRSSSRQTWNDVNKVFDFGKGAIDYIYAVAMARSTGIPDMPVETWQMRYGTGNEIKVKERMIADKLVNSINEHGFVSFPAMTFAGASPDGSTFFEDREVAVEIKSSTNWAAYKKRMGIPFDDKHQDWWQVQAEMIALNMSKCLYAAALPGIDNYSYKIIDRSPIHEKCLKQRLIIAEGTVQLFCNSNVEEIEPILEKVILKFKNK
ncbi:MAG: hypothetical protein HN704_14715 [Bacteroidetes bacterium]|nr:hypothetical protein [Bacteroidota bacterium]